MKRFIGWGAAGLAVWAAACRFVPGLAALWQGAVARPALAALHRWTSHVAFPLLEPLALALPLLCLGRRGVARMAAALVCVMGMYLLLWYPAYWTDPTEVMSADVRRVESLCGQLIDALDVPAPDFSEALTEAGDAAGLPEAQVKLARYPEWMAALGLSGLFSPWTGEVIVSPEVSPEGLPFTCVHELTHLAGLADEGAANIAAYRACVERGGAFAYSARLWALRCALDRLSREDPVACKQALARVTPALARRLTPFAAAKPNALARALGIGRHTSDYDALVDWLAGEM